MLQGLHYHTRGLPDRHTAPPPKVKTPLLMGAVDGSGQVRGLHGVPLFSVALVPLGVRVDSDGTSKQNRSEAMWVLHSHGAPAQWIRLMLAHEGGVVVRPSLTGGDGLGLCQGPCRPEGPSDDGRREAEGRSGPRGSPIPGSATC